MRKILVLLMVLSMLTVMSVGALAGDYGPNKANIPVKWTVEPFFHFFVRTNDANGNQIDTVRYENNTQLEGTGSWMDLLDFGSVVPKDRWSGLLEEIGDYANKETNFHNSSFPNLWIELSSNDNWKIIFDKPRLKNKTQDTCTEPVDLYTYYYGFDATGDTTDKEPGWNSGGWTNNPKFVLRGDMGYHLTFFMFGMEYENLKTRYGTYKTTLTFTAYQL
jgi:hypothetical protein